MTSPKAALECAGYLKNWLQNVAITKPADHHPVHVAIKNVEDIIKYLEVAIPVAKLHEEMEAVLRDYCKRGVNVPIGVILELRDRLEALKCKSPK